MGAQIDTSFGEFIILEYIHRLDNLSIYYRIGL